MEIPKNITLFNSLTRKKEPFQPLNPPFVGMYKCGPTVYGEPHLGHARSDVSFDVIYRYLLHLGFKVRFVRNITDVGHLENDADEGEDKILKKARLEQVEPMEIVQQYTIAFHDAMGALNCLRPSIEPTATAHIVEQIEMIEKILERGYGYVVNGSVYFDVRKYAKDFPYGQLSGKVLDDLLDGSRTLAGQDEKQSPVDFALWKKADDKHIMKWRSPWSVGFPGWHLECSVMSTKYLGETFDIHAGGMDLQFPHHEAEIAQNVGACGNQPAKYWMHNNMLTIEGQKMGKSLGNFITINEIFKGDHKLLQKPYSPMNIRFFILQAHYRSTLDFSNEALQASEKGLKKLLNTLGELDLIAPPNTQEAAGAEDEIWKALIVALYENMNDDFNTAKAIATLFEMSGKLNALRNSQADTKGLSLSTFENFVRTYKLFVTDVLGLKSEESSDSNTLSETVNLLIELRKQARLDKNYALSDTIRDRLSAINVILKDEKDGTTTFVVNT